MMKRWLEVMPKLLKRSALQFVRRCQQGGLCKRAKAQPGFSTRCRRERQSRWANDGVLGKSYSPWQLKSKNHAAPHWAAMTKMPRNPGRTRA